MEDEKILDVKSLVKKMISLFFGLFLYALGILATYYSKLGMSPWDVFHMGVVNHTGLTLGQVSEITGLVVIGITFLMGTIPGLGSICNMIFIGVFIDMINSAGIYKTPVTLMGKIILLLLGILIIGWASFFYLRAELGAGPRDGLMETLVKRYHRPVWLIRGMIEISVLIIGFFLGGPVGIGTLVTAFAIGFSVQFAFKLGKYDSRKVQHIDLRDLIRLLRAKNSTAVNQIEE